MFLLKPDIIIDFSVYKNGVIILEVFQAAGRTMRTLAIFLSISVFLTWIHCSNGARKIFD